MGYMRSKIRKTSHEIFEQVDAEQCDTVFVKQCEDKTEEVCADVSETRCQVRVQCQWSVASVLVTSPFF